MASLHMALHAEHIERLEDMTNIPEHALHGKVFGIHAHPHAHVTNYTQSTHAFFHTHPLKRSFTYVHVQYEQTLSINAVLMEFTCSQQW